MQKTITMGNDEFILYIRKNYNCSLTNDRLGRMIGKWIFENSKGINKTKDIVHNIPCLWQQTIRVKKTYGIHLPRTTSQFTFNRYLLPKLYDYLDLIGKSHTSEESWGEWRKRDDEEENTGMLELNF